MSNLAFKGKAAAFHVMLLALVGRRPGSTGYEIASLLKEPVTLLWPVNHSQIYPALKTLDQEGMLSREWIAQDGKPNKKKYSLTDTGRATIRTWLGNLSDEALTHEETLICSYVIGYVDAAKVARKFNLFIKQMQSEIVALNERRAETGIDTEVDHSPQDLAFGVVALYRQATMVRETRIEWAKSILKQL